MMASAPLLPDARWTARLPSVVTGQAAAPAQPFPDIFGMPAAAPAAAPALAIPAAAPAPLPAALTALESAIGAAPLSAPVQASLAASLLSAAPLPTVPSQPSALPASAAMTVQSPTALPAAPVPMSVSVSVAAPVTATPLPSATLPPSLAPAAEQPDPANMAAKAAEAAPLPLPYPQPTTPGAPPAGKKSAGNDAALETPYPASAELLIPSEPLPAEVAMASASPATPLPTPTDLPRAATTNADAASLTADLAQPSATRADDTGTHLVLQPSAATSITPATQSQSVGNTPPPPPLDLGSNDRWIAALAQDIAALHGDDGMLEFQLLPRHLGRINVSVQTGGEGVAVHIVAESAAAQSILASAQPRLLDDLRQTGIRVATTDVGGQQAQGWNGDRRDQGQSHADSRWNFIETGHAPDPTSLAGQRRSADRLA